MRLASRFGYANPIRRDRPLTHQELMHFCHSIFCEDRHTSRSKRYAYIPTITVLESLQREGFQPFFACQTCVRDPGPGILPAVNDMRTFPPSPYWKACSGKAFSHSSPARPVCATRAAGDTQNTCCVCGGPER